MKKQTLVVIGGVAAGMSAAAKAKRDNPDLLVKVYERGQHVAYGQCGLPYYLAGYLEQADETVVRTPEAFREQGVEVNLFHEALSLDPAAKTVNIQNRLKAVVETVAYDYLVLATGADPVTPNLPGIHLKGVSSLKTIPDAETINRFLADPSVEQVVLVGGGYINAEMAEAVIARGKKLRLIQRPSQVLNHMDEPFGKAAGLELEKHGILLHLNEAVESLEGDERVRTVRTDQSRYPADLVIFALGIRPNTDWLKSSGLSMMQNGAIRVNAYGRTNLDHIYAAGDCASVYHRVMKKDTYLPLGTTANKQGRLAGAAIAGNPQPFGGIVGTSIVKVMDKTFGKTGLSAKEAQAEGLSYKTVTVNGHTHAGSYPGSKEMTLQLVYESYTRRLLGAQLMGPVEGAKRLDVLALAIHNEMTVDDLALSDLSYAPPYATVWDVVQVAANAAK
jgi:NADPH-dependent 2,4-dienoyl-CoA reductase/sulfur reductase-like enzyme